MKTLNSNSKYIFTWPKLSFKERMSLLGYARYMGYEFDYNVKKRKAILVKVNDNGRKTILFLQKIDGKIIGRDMEGNKTILNSEIYLTKLLFNSGIFKIPKKETGINDFIKENLSLLVYD